MKNITIVGCGSVGFIHAYYFAQHGYNVSFLKTSDYNSSYYEKVKADGFFEVIDRGSEKIKVPINNITKDVEEVVPNADMVFVTTTTLQHNKIAKLIGPHLKDEQIVCIMPSYASSLIFKQYALANVKYVEFETTLFNGRIIDNSYININFKNCRLSAYFDGFSDREKSLFSENFIYIDKEALNTFEIAFHNPNMIVHTIGVLLSASRIEYSKGNFWMYKEAFTPSIINVINKFDAEKNLILQALGCSELSYFDAAKWRNEVDLTQDSMDVFRSFAEDSNKGPSRLRHRYLLEDVPMGLSLFQSVGDVLGIETPIADSVITLSSALLNEDFQKNGNSVFKIYKSMKFDKATFLNTVNRYSLP